MNKGVLYGLLAAALFGASTPFAKILADQTSPAMLAGLLYFSSGVALLAWFALRRAAATTKITRAPSFLARRDLPWFTGAVVAGGVVAPLLLFTGLAATPASTASLLLNMETVLTAALAWFVFRENFDRRILLGMTLIVVACVLLSVDPSSTFGASWGAVAIVGACLAWAIDNNLTRKISANDATLVAGLKGLVAGAINLGIAILLRASWPGTDGILLAALIGVFGYGVSLVLFVLALRHLGAARTGAYFSTAPFVGAVIALGLLNEVPAPSFWIAAVLMAAGIWLHLSERHMHQHTHDQQYHSHRHAHDEHHQHTHDFPRSRAKSHTHEHVHARLTHRHVHYPDIHHPHDH